MIGLDVVVVYDSRVLIVRSGEGKPPLHELGTCTCEILLRFESTSLFICICMHIYVCM
jgi:hypothetical protein